MTYLRRSSRTLLSVVGLSLPLLFACSDDSADLNGDLEEGEEIGDGDGDPSGEGEGEGTGGGAESDGGDGDPTGGAGDDGGGEGGGEEGSTGDGDPSPDPGQLTAGEWRDLDHWEFWLALGAEGSDWAGDFDRWGFNTRTRVPVLALADNSPVVDVSVTLRDAEDQLLWTARTDNSGHAELWPALHGGAPVWPLTIEFGDSEVILDERPDGLDPVILELPAPAPVADLDLMFVVDTTGSMQDELTYLTAELGDVIERVEAEVGGGFEMRVSVNFYRDVGDEYVVRSFPFTTDVEVVLGQLAAQTADGGGDYPEAVEAGLIDAIYNHDWSPTARARLLFLVLDAPPHDTPEIRSQLAQSVESAAAKGIRVIPLGASGIDKDTEFLLRNIDIATGGTYTFLTSDSGIGGPHLEPSIGEYEVELLNDLMVRLIVEAME